MKKVKMDISKLDPPKKIQKGKEIVAKMTGNKNFPTPNPDLKTVSICINDFEISYENALDGGHTLKQLMYSKEKQFDLIIVQLAGYVESVAAGDEQKILSSGFEVRKFTPHSIQTDVVKAGNLPGEVIVKAMLAPDDKNILHEWQYCIDVLPADNTVAGWIGLKPTTKANITISNLVSGSKVWVRHLAILSKAKETAWHLLGSVIVP